MKHVCDYSTPCHSVGGESISAGVLSKILFEVLFEAGGLLRYLSIDSRSSDYRTNFAVDKQMTVREEILKLLISSESILDVYFFDQYKYLESHLKAPGLGLEQDAKYFWIFRSLDYGKWAQRCGEAKILGLRGPSAEDLEFAASRIVQSLRNPNAAIQEDEMMLYFFCNSMGSKQGPPGVAGWRGMVCVWNLLRTLIKNHSAAEESLLQTFLGNVLGSLSDDELANLPDHPADAFRSLFHLFKPRYLWDALGQVLGDLKDPDIPRKRNLTLVIDLNSMASGWEEMVDSIREMTAGMPQAYGSVRILLSNLPEASDRWQTRPSEILLEYDKERKGMYPIDPVAPSPLGFCHRQ